ncbi:hypothetical protein CJF31_00009123 [Rutstroemia sp. NJR-2017a BVV2]|nr:hypothetical protein CJF31_00009123 [Rutstroemia sp. NJR-2017a BVV2]
MKITYPVLTWEVMNRLANTYFDTFNLLYPFLDRQNFFSENLNKVYTEGFDRDKESIIVLLVFVLGELVLKSSYGAPIETSSSQPSGIRGRGSIPDRLSGILLYNKARKQIGFVMTGCDLENVQIFSLAKSKVVNIEQLMIKQEFWRLMVSVSLVYYILIIYLYLELDLPLSILLLLENRVGLAIFNTLFCDTDYRANHPIISGSSFSMTGPTILSPTLSIYPLLQPQYILDPLLNSLYSPQQSRLPLFTPDTDTEPVLYPYIYDIQVVLLRTRYYYAKYIVHRPFLYKVLHFPEQTTQEDTESIAECLYIYISFSYCLSFYILSLDPDQTDKTSRPLLLLSPPSHCKRLIPYLFCWSQNFLGILLVIYLTKYNAMLKYIVENLCRERYQCDMEQSILLILDWIRDLKEAYDPLAEWCWKVLRGVYWWEDKECYE